MIHNELACHFSLVCIVRGAERNVMDRALAQIPCEKAFRFANVDDATDCFAGTTAGKGSVSVNVLEFQNVAQDGLRTVGIIEQQSDPVKAPNRVFNRDVTAVPALLSLRSRGANERKAHVVGIAEG